MFRRNHKYLTEQVFIGLDKDVPKSHIKAVITAMSTVVRKELQLGNEVKIANIGTFRIAPLKPRKYRNIHTGKTYIKEGHNTIRCRIAKALLDVV